MNIKERYLDILSKIDGRAKLIAVSKYHSEDDIITLYNLGHRDFGESRVLELRDKSLNLSSSLKDIRWHFIGHLQSNKVRTLMKVKNLVAIHSVDSLKIAKAIKKDSNYIVSNKVPISIFVEANTSHEEEKHGLKSGDELDSVILELLDNDLPSNLRLEGLMSIGPIRTEDFEEDTKNSFRELVKIAKNIENKYFNGNTYKLKLSMGMSQDYLWAIDEGSDFVRIGSSIFGSR